MKTRVEMQPGESPPEKAAANRGDRGTFKIGRFGWLMAAILAVGALLIWWTTHRADRGMRANLLIQARLVARSMSMDRIQTLTGSEKDLASPTYLSLKERLSHARRANEKCRFIYLMGRADDGAVFFFVDSEPAGSEDESPAGQIYEEISPEYLKAFDSRIELVEGPVADRWGVWITALVPMIDPRTGELVAVLGMDVDARVWKWDVAARAALPAGLMLALLILLGAGAMANRTGADASVKPIQRRLMVPLAGALLLFVGGFGVVTAILQQERLNESSRVALKSASGVMARLLAEQTRALAALEEVLARDEVLRDALKARDRERLLAAHESLFTRLKADRDVTHFYFFDPARVCLLRVHKPEKHGDRVDRFTALKAERGGRTASGIELGPLGTFTLRVVRPIFDNGVLIGYMELGKEIEDILDDVHLQSGVELAVTIRKSALDRDGWEAGMKMLGRDSHWGRFQGVALIYSTLSPFPSEVGPFIHETGHTHGDPTAETTFGGKTWRVMAGPLTDASGADVGDLVVLHDISDIMTARNRLLTIAAGGALALLAGLFGFLFVLLRRTDLGIHAQQEETRRGHARLLSILDGIDEPVYVADPETYEVLYVNNAAQKNWGAPDGKKCHEYLQNRDAPCPFCTNDKIFGERVGQSYAWEFQNEANGRWYRCVDKAITWPGDRLVRYEMAADITERKRAEETLAQRERYYRALIYSLHEDILVIDRDYRITDLNDTAARTLGARREEIIGRRCHEISHGLTAPCHESGEECGLQIVFDTGESTNTHHEHVTADGEKAHIDIRVSPLKDRDGRITHVIEAARDVTDLYLARETLRESEERLQTIFRTLPDYLMMLDRDHVIQHINRVDPGLASEDVVGKPLYELALPEDRARVKDHLERVTRKSEKQKYETCHYRPDGAKIHFSSVAAPIVVSGEVRGSVVSSRDISERKRAEEALEKRIVALTRPLEDAGDVFFDDLFNLEDIQRIQDDFAEASGVASIITRVDGTPITRPSNFCRLCKDVIRQTEKGRANCFKSDAEIGRFHPERPVIQPCMSGGLWDAGAGITVGGKHIANWLIGQVRDETQNEEMIRAYAREIGADEEAAAEAFYEAPAMSREQFGKVARALFTFAEQLSTAAYQNVQQARFITGRKRAEEALKKSEAKLVQAQYIAKMGDFTWDIDAGATTWSDGMYELLKYDRDETITYEKVNARIHHPDDLEKVTKWLTDSIASGEEVLTPNEYRLVRGDGEVIHAQINGRIEYRDGKAARIFGTCQDVTGRKKAEEELRKFRTISDRAVHGNAIADMRGELIYVNDYFSRVHGYTTDELLGRKLDVFHNEKQMGAVRRIHESMMQKGSYGPMEVWHCHRNGAEFPMLMSGVLIMDDNDAPQYIAATAIDLTDLRRAEEEASRIEKQYRQAQKVESIGRLAGGVAHDLNNLLSPILSYGEMLQEDLEPGDSRWMFAGQILRAGFRARDLVRQLLAFSRKQTLEYRPVDLNKAVAGFEKLMRRTIREDIEIEIVPSPHIPLIMADIGQIEQVIMNLAVNAQDAMPGGGRLSIETASVRLDEMSSMMHQDAKPGAYVMLAVNDTGVGMDDETRENLFEPFFTTKGDLGTGLGLATVHGIVKQHGGNIWVYSEPDKGATFKIFLPASDEERVKKRIDSKESAELKGSETILLVEDNAQVRQLAHAILKRQGYTLLVAKNGPEALEMLASNPEPVDLLLTDVIMPEMNGKEVYINASKIAPDLKVLFMSGYTDNVIAHHGVLEKGVAFIQKPFNVRGLAAKVREALEQV
ncbi:MAG: PAS domain S-box protein [Desulfobacterales bacterium]|nr:PAS domain S-box protein [Desulfobacterales bacterium]